MEEAKERVLAIYKEAAVDCYKALEKSAGTEYDSALRELFAEKYGRRQAYARILKEIFGVPRTEIQKILDEISQASTF